MEPIPRRRPFFVGLFFCIRLWCTLWTHCTSQPHSEWWTFMFLSLWKVSDQENTHLHHRAQKQFIGTCTIFCATFSLNATWAGADRPEPQQRDADAPHHHAAGWRHCSNGLTVDYFNSWLVPNWWKHQSTDPIIVFFSWNVALCLAFSTSGPFSIPSKESETAPFVFWCPERFWWMKAKRSFQSWVCWSHCAALCIFSIWKVKG